MELREVGAVGGRKRAPACDAGNTAIARTIRARRFTDGRLASGAGCNMLGSCMLRTAPQPVAPDWAFGRRVPRNARRINPQTIGDAPGRRGDVPAASRDPLSDASLDPVDADDARRYIGVERMVRAPPDGPRVQSSRRDSSTSRAPLGASASSRHDGRRRHVPVPASGPRADYTYGSSASGNRI